MTICRLCQRAGLKMAKSHIIPAALNHALRGSKKHLEVMNTEEGRTGHTQSGVHDREILCSDCEAKLGPYDKYGIEFLRDRKLEGLKTGPRGQAKWYELSDYEYDKLYLFFVSLLWRASVTTDDFFSDVSLGTLETKAADIINGPDTATRKYFDVMISKFETSKVVHGAERAHYGPRRIRMGGTNAYSFAFGGYEIIIKATNRSLPVMFAPFLLSSLKPLRIAVTKFDGSIFSDDFWAAMRAQFNREKSA